MKEFGPRERGACVPGVPWIGQCFSACKNQTKSDGISSINNQAAIKGINCSMLMQQNCETDRNPLPLRSGSPGPFHENVLVSCVLKV